jgi:hypothetical protein
MLRCLLLILALLLPLACVVAWVRSHRVADRLTWGQWSAQNELGAVYVWRYQQHDDGRGHSTSEPGMEAWELELGKRVERWHQAGGIGSLE